MIAETFQDQMGKTIRYVQPIDRSAAQGLAAHAYQQMQIDFLPVPLLTLHSPVPELMAGVWSILRETLLAEPAGSAGLRTYKEVVAATVSKINECPFCVDAHTTMLHATAEHNVAGAILRGEYERIGDPQLRTLAQWVLARRSADRHDSPPPFPEEDSPALVGTAVTFHYINRMVNIFLGDSLLPVPPALKGVSRRLLAAAAGKRFVRSVQQGKSLALVPQAALPDDLAWAASNPVIASAFAGFAKVVDECGQKALPEPVRILVNRRLQAWQGEKMGMSRHWVEEAIAELNEADRAAARLALLAALASYQVDAGVVSDFQVHYANDADLVAATAWASFAAARRVGTWFIEPVISTGRL
jgi:AhpD family alkylhydroperoxidase